jgi:hypothetical protein
MNSPHTLAELGRLWKEDALARALSAPGATPVLEHCGPMDHARVQDLLAQAEASSLAAEEGVSQRKRMMNVLVEGLENIHRHVVDPHHQAGFAVLVRSQAGYHMAFGNPVPVATAALLTHRIGIINEMDEVDLKEHYLNLLSNSARSNHGGAGLGLLTMARRSTRPMHVNTIRLTGQAAMLILELRLAA